MGPRNIALPTMHTNPIHSNPEPANPVPVQTPGVGAETGKAELWAGLLLVVGTAATIVMIAGRVMSGADQPNLAASLTAIADHWVLYGVSGLARMLSGVALTGAALLLLGTRLVRHRHLPQPVVAIFAVSGGVTALSGLLALVLTALALEFSHIVAGGMPGTPAQTVAQARWLTGTAGFSLAGLALAWSALPQWKAGGVWKWSALFSVAIGIGMQLIWSDALVPIHRFSGVAFTAWLTAIGIALIANRLPGPQAPAGD